MLRGVKLTRHQHLSYDEVNDLVKPTEETLDLIHEWLINNGVSEFNYSPAKDWVNIHIDVEFAERLLDAEYYVFEHKDGTRLSRAKSWSLPKHLHEHVDTIQPTTSFMRAIKKQDPAVVPDAPWPFEGYVPPTDPVLAKACSINGTTPLCFQTLYKTLGYKQKVPGKNQIGFNNFLAEVPIRPVSIQLFNI